MGELDNLLRRHAIWSHHLEKVCNEIGANELEFRPMPESNTAAWILSHLIESYREFVQLSGARRAAELFGDLPHPDGEELARLPLLRIFALVDAHREAFLRQVEHLRDAGLLGGSSPAGEGMSWLDLIYKVTAHEVYHCGQLAYLARVLQQRTKSAREE